MEVMMKYKKELKGGENNEYISTADLARIFGITRQVVQKKLKGEGPDFSPFPKTRNTFLVT